jgi:hypothetical protein
MFTVLAACLMVSFGVIAMLAVLQSDGHAAGQHGVEIAPATAIGVAPATVAQRTPCGQVDAQTFSDFNGNGVANVGEGPLEGVTFALRGQGGDLLELASTGADGTIHVDLVVPMLVTIEASSMPEGLWPGPRLAGQLGREVVLAGPDCSVSLGFVRAPADGLVPVAGIAGEELGTVDTAGGVIRSALSPGADGGVQVHGRIWADDLDDRRFTTADEALSGIPITLLDADGEEVAHVLTGTDGPVQRCLASSRSRRAAVTSGISAWPS